MLKIMLGSQLLRGNRQRVQFPPYTIPNFLLAMVITCSATPFLCRKDRSRNLRTFNRTQNHTMSMQSTAPQEGSIGIAVPPQGVLNGLRRLLNMPRHVPIEMTRYMDAIFPAIDSNNRVELEARQRYEDTLLRWDASWGATQWRNRERDQRVQIPNVSIWGPTTRAYRLLKQMQEWLWCVDWEEGTFRSA